MSSCRSVRLLAGVALLLGVWAYGSSPSAAQDPPVCEQDLPVASDGTLTVDQPVVQAGGVGLGLLTDFQQWPVGIVGGGSGETFLSCTPWATFGEAEVMPLQVIDSLGAGLFLFEVPADAAPGEHPVSIVFLQGSLQPTGDGTLVRLSGTVTVTSGRPPGGTASPACALTPSAAPVGQLVVGDPVSIGSPLDLSLVDVPAAGVGFFNEYDRLWFVACAGHTATPIAGQEGPPFDFAVALPPGAAPGPLTVRLLGVLDGPSVVWERTITVTAAAPTSTLPRTGGLTGGGDGSAPAIVGFALLATGWVPVIAGRRRRLGREAAAATGRIAE